MTRIMLYNHSGCENRGCEAIVRSTAAMFAQAGARVALTSRQPAYDRALHLHDVERIVPMTIAPYSVRRIINSVGFRMGMARESEVARRYAPCIALGRKSGVCLSVGGDTYCYGYQEHMAVINGRLRRAGKPLVLWGCSVEPSLLEGACLRDLQAYDLIVARESISAEAMRAAGLPVRTWCDPAFTLGREDLPLPSGWKEGGTVGLNVSPLVLDRAGDRAAALDAFVGLVKHILGTSDHAIALIPHVTWPHDDDVEALTRIKERFADEPRVFLLPGTLNALQLKGYIARLCALITARTHASIAGYSSCVPTLVIAYSVKARGIARDLFGKEEGHLIPVQELEDARQLIQAYDAMVGRAAQERAFLQERVPAYTAGQKETVDAILSLVKQD